MISLQNLKQGKLLYNIAVLNNSSLCVSLFWCSLCSCFVVVVLLL